jgi:7-carboxy-7-deazaguanine synthase
MYQINEIFYSIQGEGANVGTPAVFVRFAGCNLHCGFCDTVHSVKYTYDLHDLLDEIKKQQRNCLNVILTGGEPFLQIDSELICSLKRDGYFISVETNGTFYDKKLLSLIDWVTVSPKSKDFLLKNGTELKLVYTGQSKAEVDYFLSTDFYFHYLQPCDYGDGKNNLDDVIEVVKENLGKWRLSLQCQKLIKIK